MKIAIVADSLSGGLGSLAIRHAQYMMARHDVVIVSDDSQLTRVPADVKSGTIAMPPSFKAAVLRGAPWALGRLLRDQSPDVIHCHGLRSWALVSCAGHRSFVTLHGLPASGEVRNRRLGTRMALASAGKVARGAYCVGPHGPRNWQFLPHASPTLLNLRQTPVSEDPVFLWLGRLDFPKRPEIFIEALSLLKGVAKGVICGEGPMEPRLRELRDTLGVDVEFAGPVADVGEALRHSRALVCLSDFEGVPLALEEAMWVGRAAIASPLPGIIWLGGRSLTYAHAAETVAAAMAEYLDRDIAQQRGDAAAVRVRQLVQPDDPWPRLEAAYAQCVGASHASG